MSFVFQGEPIRTNMDLAQKTVDLARQQDLTPFFELIQEYTEFNSNGLTNLIFQVGYCFGSTEVAIVKQASNRLKEVS